MYICLKTEKQEVMASMLGRNVAVCALEEVSRNCCWGGYSWYSTGEDSGLDLFCPDDITIAAGETKIIDLGIKAEAFTLGGTGCVPPQPAAFYIYPRSSISKTPLRLANSVGIIDAGYRGNLMLALDNIKNVDYTIKSGQRLAQICSPDLKPITWCFTDELSKTARGKGGFGSTGQ